MSSGTSTDASRPERPLLAWSCGSGWATSALFSRLRELVTRRAGRAALRAHEQGQQQEAEHNDSEKCRRVDHVQRPQGSLMVAEAFGVRKRSGFPHLCDVGKCDRVPLPSRLRFSCGSAYPLSSAARQSTPQGAARTCPTRRELTASSPVERTRRKPLVERHADAANAPARRVGRGDHAAEEGDRGDERDT